MSSLQEAYDNLAQIHNNSYLGRGIVIGMDERGERFVQVYWIMGRSENSRNRQFIKENDFIKTEALDPAKLIDPSLIIYYPLKSVNGNHIVSNGDQTDTVYDIISAGGTLEEALLTREFEPDAPNYTPRITGLVNRNNGSYAYQLSILKRINEDGCGRFYYNYQKATPGIGHCIHTYLGDGTPLPSFIGEPFKVALNGEIDNIADQYWNLLDPDNRISLLVKTIDIATEDVQIVIRNKNTQ
ncbi:IMP cyclohydrolase [Paenibacillus sp. MMS18-CY102]|uniref:IMP cyclohydrolase n=1 Tax=Paenibacillus sp. MMS18-CY102 TaxID=2682849 RepID=UPI0013663627|nr:IMP cyclohydrolase [Paenibacillus sp. MMS18-CY102]MWC30584.1 inosine monophosphate cyclohydrolase [Paenibacillus sp. MMS18-CY102]